VSNLPMDRKLAAPSRPVFLLRLRPLPGVDGVRAVRAALKVLLRRFRLQCVTIETEAMEDDDV
jgi:hypothetical protein